MLRPIVPLYCSALSLARSAQAQRDNESCFFMRVAGVQRFTRCYHVKMAQKTEWCVFVCVPSDSSELAYMPSLIDYHDGSGRLHSHTQGTAPLTEIERPKRSSALKGPCLN
ncbi:hypothetical protein EVAR_27399_1 [Eumeta japonica]|uniref:Uncharacterized protein n=1 Tax=Eumeta variegata TaxID=151549 RepID=A0A4C1X4S4_EUMVA|nr:hypothetical protein EVAR_27399_1 [Eumeta japonica]